MKKKLGAIIMAGVMACTMAASLALSGCRGGRQQPDFDMPENGFDMEKEVTITFYHTMGADLRSVLERYIEKFNELYPNITIQHDQVGNYDDVHDQINNEIPGNNQPNLAYCYPDHVADFNMAGVVQPLNDFLPGSVYSDMTVTRADGTDEYICLTEEQQADFIQGYYNEGFLFDDGTKMYTMPFLKSTEVLYYNKDVFEDLGLTPPKTWDEMEEVCKILKREYPNCVPFGYDSDANWFITMCEQLGSPYTSSKGDKYLFDNQTNRDFVAKFKEWYDLGYFKTQGTNESRYTSTLFKEQNSFMSIGSSAGAVNQRPSKVDGKYPFEVGITSIPQVDPENPKVISQGPSVCIFKKDDPQEVLASWLFVKFLTTTVGFQAEFSDVSGYVPVLTSVLEDPIYQEYLELSQEDGTDYIAYYSATVCMQQQAAYYTSPAFDGSSLARTKVGELMAAVFDNTEKLADAFEYAVEYCKYYKP